MCNQTLCRKLQIAPTNLVTTPDRIAKAAATRNARGAAELGLKVEQYCGLSYMRRSTLRKFDDPKQAGIDKGWLDLEGNPLPPKPRYRRAKGAVKAAEKLPRFMNQIKAHTFSKVAAEGCYVYAYLRPRSSENGKAGVLITSARQRPRVVHLRWRRIPSRCRRTGGWFEFWPQA